MPGHAGPDRAADRRHFRAVGMPHGIIAGQAWESEDRIDLKVYHRAKTSSLFIGSTTAGAIAAGADPQNWYRLGEALGDAFQVADDLRDCAAKPRRSASPAARMQPMIAPMRSANSGWGRGAAASGSGRPGRRLDPRLPRIRHAQAIDS
jgi:hypothetical protein